LPVTHGVEYTRLHVLFYTVLLFLISLMPYLFGMCGVFYLGGAVVLGLAFLYYAIRLMNPPNEYFAMRVFNFSIVYLMALFAFLLVDHYLPRPIYEASPNMIEFSTLPSER
jgi:heme o synthase